MFDSFASIRLWPKWLRRTLTALGCVVALVVSAGAWVVYVNDFAFREQRVTIPGPAQPLEGVLALPKTGNGPFGLVVFVHGDGPADASRDSFYKPIWESFAKAGYASLSWNKPGIDGAPGNWLKQSMHDRAAEVNAAIDWARGRSDIDPQRIGGWGISQGGWVLPEAAVQRTDMQFIILVGVAINWQRQGEYNLRAELAARQAPQSELADALTHRSRINQLLRANADYEQYLAARIDSTPMSPDRWEFISRNYLADISATLPQIKIPVLLELGMSDLNVDVIETERVYRKLVRPNLLTVQTYPHASHSIVKEDLDGNNSDSLKSYAVALFAPRQLYAPGYLDDLRRYVQQLPTTKDAR
ncbi:MULTISPECIES: S9 family peptidase [unclassified Mycolicibacterium]|uniref:alpha/beta hydrolase family protein n=1 Tax=unclassified Mycolicibacterium TaxID=2636767 RepID=UPI0012DF9D1F|nr:MULTISPECIES: alpha/beta hydrolase [unclassified Mycolicibacterium]MUL82267.1 alpha/beta fold hydrolase [Mycolicibacterium sp. CBMA 329]MUL88033.1 alpha/beta fold hydrolase [Mycolicibacterium sp. CBMA 331]MUM02364.1 alpha/beta fold hydrolase [Mycolicibacterium sp. CBMA 334]MUM29120.1 alpha/beta fold hydrolase [Mycolicibacterium sp. CBMA 295]MUM38330.1 alpha/beta fold hydrolase [Mycolicibacterium sp. CBMA 247]